MESLPHVLNRDAVKPDGELFGHKNVAAVRKAASFWLVPLASKLPRLECEQALAQALADDRTAAAVVRGLNNADRAVLAAYHRYGGTVNGAVIRLDLLARGLLEKVESRYDRFSTWHWKRNPIEQLVERGALLSPAGPYSGYRFSSFGGYGNETERPFPTYGVTASLAKHLTPAGPPGWTLPAVNGDPQFGFRSSAEVALDLSRVYAFIAARKAVRVTKNGDLSVPTLRSLAKAVPLPEDKDFPLPDPHGLYFELLRGNGLLRVEHGEARADPETAGRFFALPTAVQAHHWARAWWQMHGWNDGTGVWTADDRYSEYDTERPLTTSRQVLAWALASVAHAGASWFDLTAFLLKLHTDNGEESSSGHFAWQGYAWDPQLPWARNKEQKQGDERALAYWFSRQGGWYANALLVTLPALGLVERGRCGGKKGDYCFRLTALGRTVFGAPEIAAPPEQARPFLVIQPNFDVLVYLDQADAQAVGRLGQLLESAGPRSGPVQTYRLTRASVYHALEGGLNHDGMIDLLRRYSQHEVPANVLQTLNEWAGRRESLVLHTDVCLLGFPSGAERDRYLADHQGTPLGERFVRLGGKKKPKPSSANPQLLHHNGKLRATLEIDEHGRLHSGEPYDTVQTARLRRFAEPTPSGWRMTGDTVRRAAAAGHKAGSLRRWLQEHLVAPLPPLLDYALDAWTGKAQPLELARAVLLHVPDTEVYVALAASPRVRPLLCGSPGVNWLAVREDHLQEVEALLDELGVTVKRELTHGELPQRAAGPG